MNEQSVCPSFRSATNADLNIVIQAQRARTDASDTMSTMPFTSVSISTSTRLHHASSITSRYSSEPLWDSANGE